MVYKEMVFCDICGTEIKKLSHQCLEMRMHKDVAKNLGLETLAHRRRHKFYRGRFALVTLDICSHACCLTLLNKIEQAMIEAEKHGKS